jgi:deazaflavin-dependent oxidoreductase (nitroreductase family)
MPVPTDEEFLTYNQKVIEEFRAKHGVVTEPDFPILLLTTTGARTGRRRTSPLGYGVDGGKVFVIASKGGSPTNPAWFHNLRANPSVTVELGRDVYEARANVVVGEKRERLYAILSADAPGLQAYEQGTTRWFPIVVLEGVPAPPGAATSPPPNLP